MFVEQAGVVLYLTSTLVYIPGFVLFNPLETRVFHMMRAFGEGFEIDMWLSIQYMKAQYNWSR